MYFGIPKQNHSREHAPTVAEETLFVFNPDGVTEIEIHEDKLETQECWDTAHQGFAECAAVLSGRMKQCH